MCSCAKKGSRKHRSARRNATRGQFIEFRSCCLSCSCMADQDACTYVRVRMNHGTIVCMTVPISLKLFNITKVSK